MTLLFSLGKKGWEKTLCTEKAAIFAPPPPPLHPVQRVRDILGFVEPHKMAVPELTFL